MIITRLLNWLVRGDRERAEIREEIAAIESLPENDAREQAMALLSDPARFECIEAPEELPLSGLPVAVLDVFRKYSSIHDVAGDLRLQWSLVAPSEYFTGFVRIGESELGGVESEICVRPGSERVYDLDGSAEDSTKIEREAFPTIYHFILYYATV
jgi:hypothetical protein